MTEPNTQPDPRDAELSALTHALGLSHARVAELEADSVDKLKLVTEWRECLDRRTAEKDALREELSALRKQLESSQGTISEYRRVVHRNSDDLREMVEEVRAAKRECDAAQTAARQAGRQDAATYILTHPYCREVDRMQDLCDCRPMAEDIIAGEKLPPLSSLPASAPAETRDPLAVFHDGSLIILITGLPQHYHTPAVLDWYAKTYAIERRKLGASPIQTVKYDAPAETPEALCVCGHPKSKHRPNGVCYHQCGPYLTCNCGKFEAFAPPVAPSATGAAVTICQSNPCGREASGGKTDERGALEPAPTNENRGGGDGGKPCEVPACGPSSAGHLSEHRSSHTAPNQNDSAYPSNQTQNSLEPAAETPEALCVCGHRHFTHAIRPSGDTCMVTGCNCGEWRPAPPVAPSAPGTIGGRFRKKPVVIDAVKLDPSGPHKMKLPEGVIGEPSPGSDNWNYEGCRFFIDTLEGRMEAKPGDWIITGIKGERYACRGDIFAATYEPESAPSPMEAHAAEARRDGGEAERRVVEALEAMCVWAETAIADRRNRMEAQWAEQRRHRKMNWQPGTPADSQVGAHTEEQIDREQAEFAAWRKPVDGANKVLDALAQPSPAEGRVVPTHLPPSQDFNHNRCTGQQGCDCIEHCECLTCRDFRNKRWAKAIEAARFALEVWERSADGDEDAAYSLADTLRCLLSLDAVDALAQPTPAPSQDAEPPETSKEN